MASYKVRWKKTAIKELGKIDKQIIPKIIEKVELIAQDPIPKNARKLVNSNHSYRIRIGNYRVIYSLYKKELIIEIVRVGHRRDIYDR